MTVHAPQIRVYIWNLGGAHKTLQPGAAAATQKTTLTPLLAFELWALSYTYDSNTS